MNPTQRQFSLSRTASKRQRFVRSTLPHPGLDLLRPHFLPRIGTALILGLMPIVSDAAAAEPTPEDVSRQAKTYLQAQTDAGFFSGAALIARDGQTLFTGAFGWANAEWEIPNTVATRFRIASITKTFTAALILKLVEEGRLNVTDTLDKYFDQCPGAWKRLTLHHLLTHTSGIPNYTSATDFTKSSRLAYTPEEIAATFRDRPLEFSPGEKYDYSNSNYLLLALIAEKVSGRSYDRILQTKLLDPLGLK